MGESKENIINAAVGVFAERGFGDATVRDICAAAGVNVSMVNYHFGNKEGLYAEVVRKLFSFAMRDDIRQIADEVTDEESWKMAVRKFVTRILSYVTIVDAPGVHAVRIFRWEVTHPSSMCNELQFAYGQLVYSTLAKLLEMALGDDKLKIKLWCAAIWSRMSIFALADEQWVKLFAPEGMTRAEWITAMGDQICNDVFNSLRYQGFKQETTK